MPKSNKLEVIYRKIEGGMTIANGTFLYDNAEYDPKGKVLTVFNGGDVQFSVALNSVSEVIVCR